MISVTLEDVRNVNEYANLVKKNSFDEMDIDFLWFCGDIIDKTKDIIEPINDQIETLRKWFQENLTSIQNKYSAKNEDGSIKTEKTEEGDIIVFNSDDDRNNYTKEFSEFRKNLENKENEIVQKMNSTVDIDIAKIKKDVLPKGTIKPVHFNSLLKFVER